MTNSKKGAYNKNLDELFIQFCTTIIFIFVLYVTLYVIICPSGTKRRRVFRLPSLDKLCELGDLEKVKNKINQGKYITHFDDNITYHNIDDFNKGLVIACKHGHAEIAKLMAKKGVLFSSYIKSICEKYTKLHDDLIHFVIFKF